MNGGLDGQATHHHGRLKPTAVVGSWRLVSLCSLGLLIGQGRDGI
jgi:hypothetical protein